MAATSKARFFFPQPDRLLKTRFSYVEDLHIQGQKNLVALTLSELQPPSLSGGNGLAGFSLSPIVRSGHQRGFRSPPLPHCMEMGPQ